MYCTLYVMRDEKKKKTVRNTKKIISKTTPVESSADHHGYRLLIV